MAKQKTREELIREIDLLNGERAEAESRLRENINNDALRRKEMFNLISGRPQPVQSTGMLRIESSTVPSWTELAFEIGKIVERASNNVYLNKLATDNLKLRQAMDEWEECE